MEISDIHMIPFELPAYLFHRLMSELLFGFGIHLVGERHDEEMCLELYRILIAQSGTKDNDKRNDSDWIKCEAYPIYSSVDGHFMGMRDCPKEVKEVMKEVTIEEPMEDSVQSELKSLEEANWKACDRYSLAFCRPCPNGIACPVCGNELVDSDPVTVLTSYPPQICIHCPQCEYTSTRII